jgi:two-component system, cell cycle response regulator DivK
MPGELVLIVEDNDKNLKLVRDLLQLKGYRTLEARDGKTGVALALARTPDLILMDIQLPELDGEAALRRLRAEPRTAAIPVVALTAFAMKEEQQRFLQAGFDAYIAKPIDVKTFAEHIRRLCERTGQGA